MKKQWIIGALVAVTGLQGSVPAVAQNKQGAGAILGGVIGGVLGNQVGGGSGRTAATILGIIAGSVVGSKVGRNMDNADRRAYLDAQRYCFQQGPNSSRSWRGGSRTKAYGTFRTGREGRHYRTNQVCREYSSSIYINGVTENTNGIACTNSDGSFYEVTQTEVSFGGSNHVDNDRYAGPGYNNDYSDSRRDRNRDRDNDRDRDNGRDDDRYDRDRDDDYNDDVRYPVPPGGGSHRPVPPVSGPIYRGPMSNQGNLQIVGVTRLSGGAWYRLTLNRPMILSSIQFQVQGPGMRIYDTAVVTDASQRLNVPELTVARVMNNREGAAGFINRPERVIAIDIRAESFGGLSNLVVSLRSQEGLPDFGAHILGSQVRYGY